MAEVINLSSLQTRKVIHCIQEAGMNVYVPNKRKENDFMKVYTEGLEKMLEEVSGNVSRSYQLSELVVRKGKKEKQSRNELNN